MIFPGPLSEAQKSQSQRNYNLFSLLNGFSYTCEGETFLILLATRLDCPDALISALGAMMFFGYLFLPLSKVISARIGGARCQAFCWIARNIAALMMASAAVFCLNDLRLIGLTLLMTGAFCFYGFRAAGMIIAQPLLGEFTDERSRTKLLAVSQGLCYLSSIIAFIAVSLLTSHSSSVWILTGIIVVGALVGFVSSWFISQLHETEGLRLSSRTPILQDLKPIFKNATFRRLVLAESFMNLGVIMVIPISILSMKRGYGLSDTQVILYSLIQFGANAIMSLTTQPVIDAIGSRRTMILTYLGLLLCALVWLLGPATPAWWFTSLIFFLLGTANAYVNNSMPCYFLQAIPQPQRVSASVFLAITTGAGAGIAGILISGALLNWSKHLADSELQSYQTYFILAFIALLPGLCTMLRLTKLPQNN